MICAPNGRPRAIEFEAGCCVVFRLCAGDRDMTYSNGLARTESDPRILHCPAFRKPHVPPVTRKTLPV